MFGYSLNLCGRAAEEVDRLWRCQNEFGIDDYTTSRNGNRESERSFALPAKFKAQIPGFLTIRLEKRKLIASRSIGRFGLVAQVFLEDLECLVADLDTAIFIYGRERIDVELDEEFQFSLAEQIRHIHV